MVVFEFLNNRARDFEGMRAGDFLGLLALDGEVAILADLLRMIVGHLLVAVVLHGFELVFLDHQMTIVADPFEAIVFDAAVLVLLAVDEDLFLAFLIFESDLVEVGGAALE